MRPPVPCRTRFRRPALALVLALIAVIVSTTIAYTYLSAQSTSTGIARNLKNAATARYVAETGLDFALEYVNSDPDWRTSRPAGTWSNHVAFGAGTYSIRCDDGIDANGDGVISVPAEGDGNLSDDPEDPFTITATGTVGGCVKTVRAVVRPRYEGPVILYVVANASSLHALEQGRKNLIEGWKWQVNLLSASASQSSFDAAMGDADVVLVSSLASASGNRLKNAPIGVVSECGALGSTLGFSAANTSHSAANGNQIDVINNSNYITQPYPLAPLAFASQGGVTVQFPGGAMAPGLAILGQRIGTVNTYVGVLETGAELHGGGAAIDRRVTLPTGNYAISQLSDEGINLFRRSLEWASGAVGVSAFGNQTRFGSGQGNVANRQVGTLTTLTEAGTLTSITAYIRSRDSSPRQYRYAIYSDSNGQPGALIAQTPVGTMSAKTAWKWYKLPIPATTLNAGSYWLVLSYESNQMRYRYTSGGSTRYNNVGAVTGGFSSTWGTSSSTLNRRFNIYATYTPASGSSSGQLGSVGSYSYDDVDIH